MRSAQGGRRPIPDDERIQELEAKIARLEKKLEEKDDDDAIKDRQDQYRLSQVDYKIYNQEIHSNLKGLNADDHPQYLNNSRHDVTARHGDTVVGNRTVYDSEVPTGNTGALEDLFSWLGYMIKTITGKEYWYTAPDVSLDDLSGGATEDVTVATGVDFGAETVTTATLHFVNGIYTGKD